MSGKVRGADKSLARPERKQARKHVRDARDFNNIEMQAVIKFVFLQGKAPKEILAILTETLASFIPGRAKDLSAPLYKEGILTAGIKMHVKFWWRNLRGTICTIIFTYSTTSLDKITIKNLKSNGKFDSEMCCMKC